MQRNEIYLVEVWRVLIREWRWFAGVLVLSLLVTFALTHVLKRQWKATAWIQIAQVGVVPAGEDPKVEPLMRAVERLKLRSFEDEVLKSAGFAPDAPESGLYRGSLEIEPMSYAGSLIRFSIRAKSPQLARRLAEATATQLGTLHARLEAGPLTHARQRLAQVEDDLHAATAERDRLMKTAMAQAANGRGDGGSGAALEAVLLQGKQQEIRSLQQTRSDLTARLSPTYTYRTSLMWPVYVPKRPAFPNDPLLWAIGLVIGVGLGGFAATARNALRRRAVPPARASSAAVV